MSGLVRSIPPVAFGGRYHWHALVAVLATAAVVLVLVLSGGGNTSSSSSASPIIASPTSGPNETARGNSAATASGAQQLPGGPNEDARGQAVSSASR